MNCPLCYTGPDSDKTLNKVIFGASGNICSLFGVLGQTCCGCVRRRRGWREEQKQTREKISNKRGWCKSLLTEHLGVSCIHSWTRAGSFPGLRLRDVPAAPRLPEPPQLQGQTLDEEAWMRPQNKGWLCLFSWFSLAVSFCDSGPRASNLLPFCSLKSPQHVPEHPKEFGRQRRGLS